MRIMEIEWKLLSRSLGTQDARSFFGCRLSRRRYLRRDTAFYGEKQPKLE